MYRAKHLNCRTCHESKQMLLKTREAFRLAIAAKYAVFWRGKVWNAQRRREIETESRRQRMRNQEKEEAEKMTIKISEQNKLLVEYDGKIRALEEEKKESSRLHATLEKSKAEIQKELSDLKAKIPGVQGELRRLGEIERSFDSMRKQLNATETCKIGVQKELSTLRLKIPGVEKELKRLRDIETRFDGMKQKLEASESSKTDAQKELNLLKTKLEAIEKEGKKIGEYEEAIIHMKSQVNTSEKAKKELEKQVRQLSGQMAQMVNKQVPQAQVVYSPDVSFFDLQSRLQMLESSRQQMEATMNAKLLEADQKYNNLYEWYNTANYERDQAIYSLEELRSELDAKMAQEIDDKENGVDNETLKAKLAQLKMDYATLEVVSEKYKSLLEQSGDSAVDQAENASLKAELTKLRTEHEQLQLVTDTCKRLLEQSENSKTKKDDQAKIEYLKSELAKSHTACEDQKRMTETCKGLLAQAALTEENLVKEKAQAEKNEKKAKEELQAYLENQRQLEIEKNERKIEKAKRKSEKYLQKANKEAKKFKFDIDVASDSSASGGN